MGSKRLGRVFEQGVVDSEMAGRATIGDVGVLEIDLLDLRLPLGDFAEDSIPVRDFLLVALRLGLLELGARLGGVKLDELVLVASPLAIILL